MALLLTVSLDEVVSIALRRGNGNMLLETKMPLSEMVHPDHVWSSGWLGETIIDPETGLHLYDIRLSIDGDVQNGRHA